METVVVRGARQYSKRKSAEPAKAGLQFRVDRAQAMALFVAREHH
jgi:hypothetical protein